MLIIRLQRTGKKNRPDFRIVLAEKEMPVGKKFVEVLGSYNPGKKDFKIKQDRLDYWISQRISMSETVTNLLITKGLLQGKKVKAFTIPKKPVEPVGPAAPASAVETPAEAVEAQVEMEAKIETPAA